MKTRRAQGFARAAPIALIVLALSISGCKLLGSNMNLNIQIPLGLNGTTGLLNPDGGVIGQGVDPPENGGSDPIIPPDDL